MKVNRIGNEEREALKRVLDSGTLSGFFRNMRGGPEVQAFEEQLEDALVGHPGEKYYQPGVRVLTCSNGTSALHLALMALDIGKGDRVGVPVLTFSATATSVLMLGGIPVPIDVDPKTWCMDPLDLKVTHATEPLKAVIPVHLLGVSANMTEIYNAVKGSCPIIEDNAQALLAKYRGQYTGTIGDIATLSFQDTKTMSTLGEGGAVIINENGPVDGWYQKILSLRNHGQQYLNSTGGFADYTCWNYRMTEAQAAFGAEQFRKLPLWNEYQRYNRLIFKDMIDDLGLTFQEEREGDRATYYIYGATCENSVVRDNYLAALRERGWCEPEPGSVISAGYTRTIFDLPLLKPYDTRPHPVADDMVKRFIWFDVGRWLTPDEFLPRGKNIAEIMRGALQ